VFYSASIRLFVVIGNSIVVTDVLNAIPRVLLRFMFIVVDVNIAKLDGWVLGLVSVIVSDGVVGICLKLAR